MKFMYLRLFIYTFLLSIVEMYTLQDQPLVRTFGESLLASTVNGHQVIRHPNCPRNSEA
jgi:hypothetical protein